MGRPAEVIDLTVNGVRVTLMPTVSSRAERSPDPRESAIFLKLAEPVFDRFRPDVLLTYGRGHPAGLELMLLGLDGPSSPTRSRSTALSPRTPSRNTSRSSPPAVRGYGRLRADRRRAERAPAGHSLAGGGRPRDVRCPGAAAARSLGPDQPEPDGQHARPARFLSGEPGGTGAVVMAQVAGPGADGGPGQRHPGAGQRPGRPARERRWATRASRSRSRTDSAPTRWKFPQPARSPRGWPCSRGSGTTRGSRPSTASWPAPRPPRWEPSTVAGQFERLFRSLPT